MHLPVMLDEVVEMLNVKTNGRYVDGTLGSGGHSEAVLERLGPAGRLYGIDRDGAALERCDRRLARYGERYNAFRGHYAEMGEFLARAGVAGVDGVLLDLGVSSNQLDEAERGFSFLHSGPLDMRMDQRQLLTGAEIVNSWDESALADLFYQYGEERQSRRVARAIVERRAIEPFTTTGDLAAVIERALGGRRGAAKHPATRCFQAIRMAVNDELDGVERGLEAALSVLNGGGRLVVITFHSLEDRLVKRFMRRHEGREVSLAAGGSKWEGDEPRVKQISRKVIVPAKAECAANPRSRSAKLRVAERLAVAAS